MALSTYSHSLCPTARLFLLKEYFDEISTYVIITDKKEDRELLMTFGDRHFKQKLVFIDRLEKLWSLKKSGYIYIIHPHLLELQGTKEYIQKHTSIEFSRGDILSMESLIESLINAGYDHKDYLDESGTYKKEGNLVTITHPFEDEIIQVEYFDTEIDSIVISDRVKSKRIFVDSIILPIIEESKKIQRSEGILNDEILSLLPSRRIVIGCDFLSY